MFSTRLVSEPGLVIQKDPNLYEFHVFRNLSKDLGWELVSDTVDPVPGVAREISWRFAKKGVLLKLQEVEKVLTYVSIFAESESAVHAFATWLRRDLKGYFFKERVILTSWENALCAENFKKACYAITCVGGSAPSGFDPFFFHAFEQAMALSDAKVRKAALFAMSFPHWKELKPLAEKALSEDPDKRVREQARLLLEEYQQQGFDNLDIPPCPPKRRTWEPRMVVKPLPTDKFRIYFGDIRLSGEKPLSQLKKGKTYHEIMAQIRIVASGELLPDLCDDDGGDLQEWCEEIDHLEFGLPFDIPPKESKYAFWGRMGERSDLVFRRLGEEVSIITSLNRKKLFHCTHQEMEDGIGRFKAELKAHLLAEAPRDAVAEWWHRPFIEDL